MSKHVLVMYDVRGIQSYIFKTPKLKDAIGASAIVENIIDEALEYAVKGRTDISYDLVWTNESGAIEFTGFNKDVQVLYIGGGNAYVMYSSRELAVEINKVMSKYVLENTYSLQLAIAIIDANIEGDYNKDYEKLHSVMSNNKALMAETKPLGTLPFMEVELSTGLPIDKTDKDGKYSFETLLKLNAEKKIRSKIGAVNKKFDEFIECKNKDSTLAVVHIDGNNMGLRIKKKLVTSVNMLMQLI